ncbi:hypothetical protein Q1695_001300 [Nippostrongylus brasiliensis]|nr:hypothetical protein Q1695_001300 [Nippostrongylus brasiliensis]
MLRIPESSASASLQLHRAVVHCCVFQSCFLKDRSTDAEIEVQSTPTNKGGIVATAVLFFFKQAPIMNDGRFWITIVQKILMNVETCTELQELINRAKSLQERSELNLDVGEVEQQHEATGFEEMVENLEAVELLDIITTQLREATEELQSLRESLLEGKKDRSHSNWEQRMFERRKARLRAIEKATRRQELLSKSECHDEPGPSGCTCYIKIRDEDFVVSPT